MTSKSALICLTLVLHWCYSAPPTPPSSQSVTPEEPSSSKLLINNDSSNDNDQHPRYERHLDADSTTAYPPTEEPPQSSGTGIGLGGILGLLFLGSCILYCLGIGYKIVKIIKGTYVEEEPVFLKYK